MSQPLSQSRMSYSRDFLLKYQYIYTPDTTIISKLTPYLSPPRSTQKRPQGSSIIKSKNSPPVVDNVEGFIPSQRLQKSNPSTKMKPQQQLEKTPNPKAKLEWNATKTQNSPQALSYKPRFNSSNPSSPSSFSQKENHQLIENNNMYVFQQDQSITNTPKHNTTFPLKQLPPGHSSHSCAVEAGLDTSLETLEVDKHVSEDLELADGKTYLPSPPHSKSQVYFYESKFASLFFPQTDTTDSNSDTSDFKYEKDEDLSPKRESIDRYGFGKQHLSQTSDSLTSIDYSLSPSKSLLSTSNPESASFKHYNGSPDSMPSNWSSMDSRGTPKTNFRNPKSPEGTPYKAALATTPFRSSKTPTHKSPHGTVVGRPISPLDDQRLVQRQKQIDYGYRTVGYLRYRLLVPKEKRKPEHPRTPKKAQGCSKRSWDGQLKKWRRDLHLWDPDNMDAFKALLNSDLVVTMVNGNPELAEIVRVVREKLDNPSAINADDDCDSEEEDLDTVDTPPVYVKPPETLSKKTTSEPRLDRVARTLVF